MSSTTPHGEFVRQFYETVRFDDNKISTWVRITRQLIMTACQGPHSINPIDLLNATQATSEEVPLPRTADTEHIPQQAKIFLDEIARVEQTLEGSQAAAAKMAQAVHKRIAELLSGLLLLPKADHESYAQGVHFRALR